MCLLTSDEVIRGINKFPRLRLDYINNNGTLLMSGNLITYFRSFGQRTMALVTSRRDQPLPFTGTFNTIFSIQKSNNGNRCKMFFAASTSVRVYTNGLHTTKSRWFGIKRRD